MSAIGSLPEVLRAFQHATGWSLQYAAGPEPKPSTDMRWSAPVNPGVGASLGHLRLGPSTAAPGSCPSVLKSPPTAQAVESAPGVPFESARALASALAGMLGELMQVRDALRHREAELAAGVPLVPDAKEQEHLAIRLEAVLRGGAEAVGCDAAALYLLDAATSELKLRSCWGLPLDRLTAPPRPLQGAVADLESLLGHAVVLDDAELMRHWHVPEDFPAAVCVPVSTPTTILGTLWIFSNRRRDFTDRETNVIEVVAGRIGSDLEREMLWHEGLSAADLKSQVVAAERFQRNQMPRIAPVLDDWDLAGWSAQGGALGGDFHDWFCLPDGLLAVAAGHAMDHGVEAALAASALKAALRAHGQYYREAQQTIKRLNLTLWTGSAGDQHASLFYGLIETTTGRLCCASAGEPGVLRLRANGWESLTEPSARLGEGPESHYEQYGYDLDPGDLLLLFTEGVRDALDADGRPLGEAGLAELLARQTNLSAAAIIDRLRRHLESSAVAGEVRDRTILVVKRRAGRSW